MTPAPFLAGALLAILCGAAAASDVRRVEVGSHSLFPAEGAAGSGELLAATKAADASGLKPVARKVPMPIELELFAEVDANGQVAFRCAGGPVRDFRDRGDRRPTGGRR